MTKRTGLYFEQKHHSQYSKFSKSVNYWVLLNIVQIKNLSMMQEVFKQFSVCYVFVNVLCLIFACIAQPLCDNSLAKNKSF